MELNKEKMYINTGFGAPHIGYRNSSDRPIIKIGGRHFALEQVGLQDKEFIVLLYEAWGKPESHAPMTTCGKMYMFYSFGKGIWHVDESYMEGFKSDDTAKLMSDIANSAITLFNAELEQVDCQYGTHYATAIA
jgi:hypothetical protein